MLQPGQRKRTNKFDLIHCAPAEGDIFRLGNDLSQMFGDDDDIFRLDEDKEETSSAQVHNLMCSTFNGHHT